MPAGNFRESFANGGRFAILSIEKLAGQRVSAETEQRRNAWIIGFLRLAMW